MVIQSGYNMHKIKNIEAAQALGIQTLFIENNADWTGPITELLQIN